MLTKWETILLIAKVLINSVSNNQVVFRYSDKIGQCTNLENPNGSTYNIAGIINTKGSIMGMMPHPERYYNNKNKDFTMKKILESITNAK